MYNYFPWPSNMRTADKVLAMRISEGAAGYGIYVMLLELLRDSETRSLVLNPKHLAFAINEPDAALVERVIKDYGLFEIAPDGAFRSPWLQSQMEEYDAKKEAAREAGKRGAAKRYGHKAEDNKQPDSNPIGTLKPPPSVPYSNITNNIREDKINETKSKLLGMTWGEMSGQDLFSLGRTYEPVVDPILERWAEGKQKELDEQRGRGKHNIEVVYEVCVFYGLGQSMFSWLCKFTNLGEVGQSGMVKLMTLWKKNQADKFCPKYPAEYILVKLLEQ